MRDDEIVRWPFDGSLCAVAEALIRWEKIFATWEPYKMTDKGLGLLCEEYDFEKAAMLDARRSPEQRRARAEAEEERAVAERLASEAVELGYAELSKRLDKEREDEAQRPLLDAIDDALVPHLKPQLAAENAKARISKVAKKDFIRFKECCLRWALPSLPASPQAAAVYLAEESDKGATHVARLARSISTIHTAVGFPDPCADVLVRALLRSIRDDKGSPQQKENLK